MEAEWLDETDCVGLWRSAALAAVVFPTADTLSSLRQLAGMVRALRGSFAGSAYQLQDCLSFAARGVWGALLTEGGRSYRLSCICIL